MKDIKEILHQYFLETNIFEVIIAILLIFTLLYIFYNIYSKVLAMKEKIKDVFIDLWSLNSFKVVMGALCILLLLTVVLNFIYPNIYQTIYGNIFSGIVSGLIITSFHVFLDFERLRLVRIIKNSRLKNMLANRKDEDYYKFLLEGAKSEVSIMGVTGTRFFQHYGSTDSDKRLIDKLLDKGVIVKILLSDNKSSKAKLAKPYINKYKNNEGFNVRYFKEREYIPQSIFIIDNQCILGPIFTGVESKETAAMHFYEKYSDFAKQYIDYFEKIWDEKSQSEA